MVSILRRKRTPECPTLPFLAIEQIEQIEQMSSSCIWNFQNPVLLWTVAKIRIIRARDRERATRQIIYMTVGGATQSVHSTHVTRHALRMLRPSPPYSIYISARFKLLYVFFCVF